MPVLTTLAALKAYLGVTHDNDNDLLETLIGSESVFIESWLGRKYGTSGYTDIFSGNGGSEHLFWNYPVTAVTNLTIDGKTVDEAETIQDTGYMVYDSRLLLFGHVFSWGKNNCRADYNAGEDVPADVRQACIELAAIRYKNRDRIGLKSKGLAGETITYDRRAIPDEIKAMLQPHRKVMIS